MAGNPEGSDGIGIEEGKGNGIGGSPGNVKTGGGVLAASGADASGACGLVAGCAVVAVTGVPTGWMGGAMPVGAVVTAVGTDATVDGVVGAEVAVERLLSSARPDIDIEMAAAPATPATSRTPPMSQPEIPRDRRARAGAGVGGMAIG